MKLWFRLAFKEIRNNSRFSLFFIMNLTLGLVGFIALDSFKLSIQQHVERNSKAILTADIGLSSNQPFNEKDLEAVEEILGPDHEAAASIRFFSMVAGPDNSRLIRVIGIDENYPLYGNIVLKNSTGLELDENRRALSSTPSVWSDQDLLIALGLQAGESLKIGEQQFQIVDSIVDDPASAVSTFAGLPKVYIGLDQVYQTNLIRPGSRIAYSRYYKLPEGTDGNAIAQQLRNRFEELYPGSPKIRVQTHREASDQLGRVLNYLNDYLGLVALIALFLAGVGGAYLFRSYLESRFKEMAILMSLGTTRKQAYVMALAQIAILGLVSAIMASVLAFVMLPLLPLLLENFLPKGMVTEMSSSSLLLALFMGGIGSILFCLPILTRIQSLNPISLFHEHVRPTQDSALPVPWVLLSYVPGIIAYWLLSIWQAHSIKIGSLFVGMFLGSLLLLGLVGWLILTGCGKLAADRKITGKIALRNLNRNKMGAISCFIAIGLGSLLLNLIPQIQRGLEEEIQRPSGVKVPSFFLFDIQPEQVAPMKTYLKENNYQLAHLSPTIRARLEKVNGNQFLSGDQNGAAITREQETERRFRNRGFNLSYREGLFDSETLLEGKPITGKYDWDSNEIPQISMETRFAKRLGLKIGDVLTFDVQDVPIEGRIVNLRRVKWNSFQPNFFISFQPGVLEDAPKMFLASISNVQQNRKLELQNGIVKRFPNVSIIDVSRVMARLLDITDQISWALRAMASLSILAGLVVLFSIARHEAQSRFWEINLLKVLGARFQDVRSIIQIEFGILGFFASIFGVLLSIIISYGAAYIMFESLWSFSWSITGTIVVAISILSIGTALLATRKILRQKPLELLKAV